MSRCSSLNHLKAYASAALALLSFASAGSVHAQTAVTFSDLDWTMDRGNRDFKGTAATQNGTPARLGANSIYTAGNNPGSAVRRWTFPLSRDLYGFGKATALPIYSIIDNPNVDDPLTPDGTGLSRYLPYLPLSNGLPEAGPGYINPATAGGLPGFAGIPRPHTVFTNGTTRSWIIPPIDLRIGGYSRGSDPSKFYNFDYDYVLARHDDFPIVRDTTGQTTPLLDTEATSFPNVAANIYRGVHQRLISSTATEPYAQWNSGQLQPGRYAVELFSPGNGTNLGSVAVPDPRANTNRVFVRVSWKGTVDLTGNYVFGSGVAGTGGINDPANSRIYCIDLAQPGWIQLSGTTGIAGFPYNGTAVDQLVVTQYTITPDSVNTTTPAVLTADAVRFTALLLPGSAGLGPVGTEGGYVSASGRILGPAVSSSNVVTGLGGLNPLFYFAREEYTADSTRRLFDPGDDFSGTTPDPVSLAVVPVFYCVDNQNGNALAPTIPPVLVTTKNKVRWRYVGAPLNNASPGTSVASPVLANVRCRDGNVRSMVYFSTTTSDGSLGRVYALDPAGDKVRGVTTAYWAYPSIRPLIGNEGLGTNTSVQGEFQDPNYTLTGFTRGGYPLPSFGIDKSASLDGAYYYDGDIVNVGGVATVRTDTRLTTDRDVRNGGGGTLGGIQASPMIVDDPSDPNGANLLIVPSMNGRVYAFDAGGRGDFGTLAPVVNASGTTQRIWTWPHLGVDGFRHPPIIQTQVNTLVGESDKLAFPSTPSIDTSAGTSGPIFLGGGDASKGNGYLYSLNLGRDVFSGIVSGSAVFAERRAWQYPSATATTSLLAPPSIAAVYNLEGSRTTPLIYFTAGGRVYTVDPATLIAPLGQIPTPNLQWVYPYTANIPNQEAGNDATVALSPGFLGNAPLLQRALWSDGTQRYLCTVVTSSGRILTLNPLGVGAQRTTVLASTQSFNGSTVRTSPIATLLTGQVGTNPSPNRPAFIFGDDSGSILGYATVPNALDPLDPITNLPFNRLIWQYGHPAANSAGTILSNSIVGVGDEGGIFHAYGVGIGAGGIGETIGENPPLPRGNQTLPQGDGTITVDIRSFDVYREADYNLMMTASGAATPGHTTTGAPFAKTRNPAPGDFAGSNAIVREWGDGLYAVAWGVYHALPQDKNLPLFGTAPPNVSVTFTVTGTLDAGSGVSIPAGTITVPAFLVRPDGTNWPADLGLSLAEMNTLKITGLALPTDMTTTQFQGTTDNVYPWVAKVPITNNGTLIDMRYNPGATYRIRAVATIRQESDTDGGIRSPKSDTSIPLFLGQHDYLGKTDSQTQANINDKAKLGEERSLFVAHPFAVSVRGGANFGTNGPNLIGWFGDISTAFTDSQKAEILANGNDLGFPVNGGGVKNLGTKTLFAPLGMVQDNQSKGYTVLGGINDAEIKPGLYVVDRSNLSRTFGPSVSVKVKATVVSAHWMGRTTSVMNPLPWEQFPTETESTPDYPALSSEAFTLTSGGKSVTETGINLNQPGGLSAINRILNPTQIDLSVKIPKFQPANVNFGRWTDGKRGTYGAGFEGQDGVVRGNGAKAGAMFGPLVIGTGDVTNNRDYLYPSGGYISNIRLDSTTAPVNGNANVNYAGVYGQKGAPYRFMDMGVSVPPTVRMKMGVDTIDLGKLSHSAGYSDLVEKSNDFRSPFAPFNLGAGFDPTLPVPTKEDYWSSYFRPFTLISESNVNLVRVRIAKLFGPNNSTIGVGSLTNFPGANVATALQVKATSNDDTTLLPIFGIGIAQPGLRNIGIVSSFDHPSLNSNNYSETNLWEKVLNPFVTNAGITNAGLPLVDRPATGELGWGNQIQRQPTVHKPRIGDNAGTVASIPDIPYNSSLALQFPGGFKTELPKISVAIPLGTPSGEYKSKIIAYEDNTPFQWRNWLLISKNLNTDPTNPGADADGILNSYSNDPAKFSDFALEAFTDPGMTLKVQVVETRLTNNAGKGSLAQMDPLLDPNLTQFPSANLMPTVVTSLGVPEKGVSYNGVSMFWPTNRGTKNGQGVNALTPWSLAFSWLSTSATELRANGNSPVQIGEARFVVPGSDAQPQGAHWWAIPTPYVDLTNTTLLQTLFPSNVVEATATGSLYLQGNRNPATARAISPAATRLEEIGNLYSTEGVLFWQGQIVKTDGIRQVTDSRTFYTKLGLTKLGAAGGSLAPVGVTQSFLNDPALTKQNPKPLYVMLPATRDSPKQVVTFLFWQAGNRSKSQLYYNANATADLEPGAWSKDTILPTPAALSSLSEPTAVLRRAFNANGNLVDAIEVAYSGKIKNRNNIEILLSRFEIGREIINEKTVITLKPMLLPNSFREPTVTKPGVVGTYIARDAAWILDNKPENKILVQAPDGKGGFNLLNPGNGKFEEGTGLVYFDSTVGGQIVVDTRAGSVSFPNIAPPRGTTIYVTYTPQVARLNVSRNESNFDVFTNNNGGFSLLEPSLNRQPAGNIIGDNTNPTMIIDRTPNRRNRLSAPSVVFAPNGTAVSPLAGDAFIPSLARRWLLYRKAAPTGTLSGIYYKTQRVVIQLPRSVRVNYNANGSSFVALSILNGVQGSGYEVDWSRGRVYFDEQMDGQKVTIIFTDSTGTTHQGMTYIAKWGDETNSSSGGTTEALMPIDTSVSEGQVTAYKDPFVDKLWVYWTSTRNGVSDLYYQTIAPQFYPNQP